VVYLPLSVQKARKRLRSLIIPNFARYRPSLFTTDPVRCRQLFAKGFRPSFRLFPRFLVAPYQRRPPRDQWHSQKGGPLASILQDFPDGFSGLFPLSGLCPEWPLFGASLWPVRVAHSSRVSPSFFWSQPPLTPFIPKSTLKYISCFFPTVPSLASPNSPRPGSAVAHSLPRFLPLPPPSFLFPPFCPVFLLP